MPSCSASYRWVNCRSRRSWRSNAPVCVPSMSFTSSTEYPKRQFFASNAPLTPEHTSPVRIPEPTRLFFRHFPMLPKSSSAPVPARLRWYPVWCPAERAAGPDGWFPLWSTILPETAPAHGLPCFLPMRLYYHPLK